MRHEIRRVVDGDALGITPKINVLEHGGDRRFSRRWSKQEAWKNPFLCDFDFQNTVGLTWIPGVWPDRITAYLNVEHPHPLVTASVKGFGIQRDVSGPQAESIGHCVVQNLGIDG